MRRLIKKKLAQFRDARARQPKGRIHCNICEMSFHPHSIFERYCSSCRKSSSVFKISEWLPDHALQF
jgi:hypothetical protein